MEECHPIVVGQHLKWQEKQDVILHLKEDSFVDEKPPEEEHLMTGAEIDLSPAETVSYYESIFA